MTIAGIAGQQTLTATVAKRRRAGKRAVSMARRGGKVRRDTGWRLRILQNQRARDYQDNAQHAEETGQRQKRKRSPTTGQRLVRSAGRHRVKPPEGSVYLEISYRSESGSRNRCIARRGPNTGEWRSNALLPNGGGRKTNTITMPPDMVLDVAPMWWRRSPHLAVISDARRAGAHDGRLTASPAWPAGVTQDSAHRGGMIIRPGNAPCAGNPLYRRAGADA